MLLKDCNPYIRTAEIQAAILERTGLRKAYDYRLFYVLENEGEIQIGDQSFQLQAGSIVILPPDTAYDFRGAIKVAVLNFDVTRRFAHKTRPLFPPRVTDFDPSLLFETELLEEFREPRVWHPNSGIRSSVLQIVYSFNSRDEYADARASAQLKLLFAELLTPNEDPKDKHTEQILIYIRAHAASIRGNEDVARAFGYHSVYLNSLIRQASGKTLHRVITDAKLEIACQYLTETEETIETISYLAGFCSRTHFCTLFKKIKGLSPAQYRKLRARKA